MLKKVIATAFFCSCLYSYSAEEAPAPIFSTYLGEQLTPETLPLFAPQLPQEDLQAIRTWMNDPLRNRIIRELARLPWPLAGITGNFAKQIGGIRQMLQFHDMPNLSSWNCIFKIGDTKYFMYIAGILNRVSNLRALNRVPSAPDAMCDKLLVKQPPTYQNVSRLALYLRAKEALEKFKCDKVRIPATYLVGLDQDMPDKVNDDTSVIVQESYGPYVRSIADFVVNKCDETGKARPFSEWRIKEDQAHKISAEAVRQLAIMCVYAPIFDVSYDNIKIAREGHFVFSDFEQPNGSNPDDFFNKNEDYVLNVSVDQAIKGFNTIFGFNKYPHLQGICEKLMKLSRDERKQIGSGQLPESLR